jgi:hypothetical protein
MKVNKTAEPAVKGAPTKQAAQNTVPQEIQHAASDGTDAVAEFATDNMAAVAELTVVRN